MDGEDGPNLCRFNSERHTCNILYYTRKERMKKLLALLIFVPAVGHAQTVTPNFTQGSMQATTTTTTTIDRTIETEVMGGAYSSWSGTNVTPSGDITNSSTTFSVHTAGDPFQLEITTRAAGTIEEITITEDIDVTSTTTSLSIFSQ
jgi:hypothetical protein